MCIPIRSAEQEINDAIYRMLDITTLWRSRRVSKQSQSFADKEISRRFLRDEFNENELHIFTTLPKFDKSHIYLPQEPSYVTLLFYIAMHSEAHTYQPNILTDYDLVNYITNMSLFYNNNSFLALFTIFTKDPQLHSSFDRQLSIWIDRKAKDITAPDSISLSTLPRIALRAFEWAFKNRFEKTMISLSHLSIVKNELTLFFPSFESSANNSLFTLYDIAQIEDGPFACKVMDRFRDLPLASSLELNLLIDPKPALTLVQERVISFALELRNVKLLSHLLVTLQLPVVLDVYLEKYESTNTNMTDWYDTKDEQDKIVSVMLQDRLANNLPIYLAKGQDRLMESLCRLRFFDSLKFLVSCGFPISDQCRRLALSSGNGKIYHLISNSPQETTSSESKRQKTSSSN